MCKVQFRGEVDYLVHNLLLLRLEKQKQLVGEPTALKPLMSLG